MHARFAWPWAMMTVILSTVISFAVNVGDSESASLTCAANHRTFVQLVTPKNTAEQASTIQDGSSDPVSAVAKPSNFNDPFVGSPSDFQTDSDVDVDGWALDLNPEVNTDALGGLLSPSEQNVAENFETSELKILPAERHPFQFMGSYQAQDVATRDVTNDIGGGKSQSLSLLKDEQGPDDFRGESSVLVQEPEFRLASSPKLNPHIKRYSEVVPVRRGVGQPIAEIEIPEWDPRATWAKPTALVTELERLEQIPQTATWAADTKQLIKLLHWTESIDDPQCEVVFSQLATQLDELNEISIQVSTTPVNRPEYVQGQLSTELRALHYDIARRLMIWGYAYDLSRQKLAQFSDVGNAEIGQMILASQSRLTLPGVGAGWSEYLLLDDLSKAFNSLNPDEDQQVQAARATLARLYSSVLSQSQRDFLNQRIDDSFVEILRSKATQPVQLSEMIGMLERHEAQSSGFTSDKLNGFYQSLLWASDKASQDLAGQFEGHYRNANFRVSVSDRMINRLLPETQETEAPIAENIMGAQVRGNSRIQNRLKIQLIPDSRKVNLRLESNGLVRSLTQARQSGFVIDNVGQSRFKVFKRIGFHRGGIESDAPQAVADAQSQVVGMKSNLDPIPVVGWVARRIAQNKIQDTAPMTDRLTRQKVEQGAKDQIETEVQSQLDQVSDYLFDNMLQPLMALDVEPTPLEMRTTQERIVLRYRLAGRDQMAAHTARPRALASSLLSVQFHESVFNNLLDRIEIRGEEFTARELTDHLQNVFGSRQAVGSNEVDHKANFVFAPYDPMRIEFEDSKIVISLNLRKFRVGKGKTWKNLTVRATFNPQVRGTQLILVRDNEGIRLKGANLKVRDHMAVRAIFTALFRERYEMNVLPESFLKKFGSSPLEISQLVLNDGWLGLSLGDAPRTAATFTDQR